jgi:hypothetical protein
MNPAAADTALPPTQHAAPLGRTLASGRKPSYRNLAFFPKNNEFPGACHPVNTRAARNRRLINWIMLAILVWGGVLALGAYTSPKMNTNPLRTLVVYAFVAAFVGFWAILLKFRDSRP